MRYTLALEVNLRMLARLSFALLWLLPATVSAESKLTFRLSYPADVQSGPLTGRAYVIISRTNEKEPRLQVGRTALRKRFSLLLK